MMINANAASLGLLVLRVAVGLTFAAHGYAKFFSGGRITGTARWFDSMGMRPGKVHAVAAATTEMGSGLLLALGLLTPFAGAGIVGVMVVAGYTAHRANGFFIVKDGWEYNFVLSVVAVSVATTGAGRWSLDRVIWDKPAAWDLCGAKGLLIALVLGGLGGTGQIAAFYRPPAKS